MTLETYFRIARWRTEGRSDLTPQRLRDWALAWSRWICR
jgi:hypothetical protein